MLSAREAFTAKKAVVLAAGLGTRLRPFTAVTPKPLLPVWGEPMLARIVALLRSWGVEEIAVNAHYLSDQVAAWCAANGCRVSVEEEILGTGGVLNPLRDFIGDEPFYLVNGDIVVENVPRLAGDSSEREVLGWALVTDQAGPRTIELEPERQLVTCWKSPDPGWDGTFTYCGLALLKPEILDYVAPTGFSSIVEAYEKAMMAGRFVRGVTAADLLWTDAGTVASYLEVNRTADDNAYAELPPLKAALAVAGGADRVEFLGARGSDRVFFKLVVDGAANGIAIVYDDAKRGENAKYAGHAKWLQAKGVPVPEVLADLPAEKTLVMSWAGGEKTLALADAVKVVEALGTFGKLGEAAAAELDLEPAFGPELWRWERELFAEHCLGTRFRHALSAEVRAELEAVAERLEREPKALVHRDFQSTNVLWKNGELRFIDFQGMRLGPGAYDLASFLYDPYRELFAEEARAALVTVYERAAGRAGVAEVLPFAAVERLVQCLGAYGRLAAVGQPQFGKFVLPALEHLLSAADEAGLEALGALAEDLIAHETHAREHGLT